MAISPQGAVSGEPGTPSVSTGIAKRDADRARYMARQQQRQSIRNRRSHKRGFGTAHGMGRLA